MTTKPEALLLIEALENFKSLGYNLGFNNGTASLLDSQGNTLAACTTETPLQWTTHDEHLEAGFPEDGPLATLQPYVQYCTETALRYKGLPEDSELDEEAVVRVFGGALAVIAEFDHELRESYDTSRTYYIDLEDPRAVASKRGRKQYSDSFQVHEDFPGLDELLNERLDRLFDKT